MNSDSSVLLNDDKNRDSSKRRVPLVTERVGQKLRLLRKDRKFSIRALADRSNLSVNTLSLIENGKTSPSVSTLFQLAQSLEVPITAFFETEHAQNKVSYQRAGERQQLLFSQGRVEKLNEGLPHMGSEPFITKLEPGANSGSAPIVFPGRVFIYCLEGHIAYSIENTIYPLAPGDSLIFDAHVPHAWRNTAETTSCVLLVLCPENSFPEPLERYFMP